MRKKSSHHKVHVSYVPDTCKTPGIANFETTAMAYMDEVPFRRAGISQWVRSAAASLPISTGQLRLLRPQAAGFRLYLQRLF
jgi:hypothetical protein